MTNTRPDAAHTLPAGAPEARRIDPTLKLLLEFLNNGRKRISKSFLWKRQH